jgi:hypothetical protein
MYEAFLISFNLDLFQPKKELYEWLENGVPLQLGDPYTHFKLNPHKPNRDRRLSIGSVNLGSVLEDSRFVPSPLFRNMMFKCSPAQTTFAVLRPQCDSAIVVEIQSGLMWPRLINYDLQFNMDGVKQAMKKHRNKNHQLVHCNPVSGSANIKLADPDTI